MQKYEYKTSAIKFLRLSDLFTDIGASMWEHGSVDFKWVANPSGRETRMLSSQKGVYTLFALEGSKTSPSGAEVTVQSEVPAKPLVKLLRVKITDMVGIVSQTVDQLRSQGGTDAFA